MSATEQQGKQGNSLDLREKSRYEASLRLSVAPMLDWTDTHCRVFHRLLAPRARLYSEMLHANAVLRGDRDKLLAMHPSEHPVALQLGGSEPQLLAQAARVGAAAGFDEINLNCGCPSDRVQAGRFGACLMREAALVADCVRAMADAVGDRVPVSVKCRLGVDEDNNYAQFRDFVDATTQAGSAFVIVHARNAWLKGLSPKENREVPPLRYDWAYRLKSERPELPVVLNGGIDAIDAAQTHLRHVDGVMLGRAAYHDPYLLHRLHAALFDTPLQTRARLLQAYRPYVEDQFNRGVPLRAMVKPILGLFAGEYGGRAFRRILSDGLVDAKAGWSLLEQAMMATGALAETAA